MTLGERASEVFSVRWSQEDSHLAAAMGDGTVRLFSAADGSFIRALNCRSGVEYMPVTGIRWRPVGFSAKTKNVLLAITCEGEVMHWHATSGKELYKISHPGNQCLALDYSSDGNYFAIGCQDRTIKVYDESTKSIICELSQGLGERIGHSNRIFTVKWLDESTVISAGWDNNVLLWDLRLRQVSKCMYGPHICGDAIDVCGDSLLTASFRPENQLEQWSLVTGELMRSQTLTHENRVCPAYAVQYSKRDQGRTIAVGGSGGNECFFMDVETWTPFAVLTNMDKPVFSIDHAYSDNRVAIGCGDGTVRIVEIVTHAAMSS